MPTIGFSRQRAAARAHNENNATILPDSQETRPNPRHPADSAAQARWDMIEGQNAKLARENEMLKRFKEESIKQRRLIEKERDGLMSELNHLKEQKQSLETELAQTRFESVLNCSNCAVLEEDLGLMQEHINALNADRIRTANGTGFEPPSSQHVEDQLRWILGKIKQWCEKNCHDRNPWPKQGRARLERTMIAELAKRECISSEQSFSARFARTRIARSKQALPYLLTAAISHDVVSEVIANPFFAFCERGAHPRLLGIVEEQGLESLLDRISESDRPGALAWRSQLMCLLDPKTTSAASSKIQAMARESRKSGARTMSQNLYRNFQVFLKREDASAAKCDLERTLLEAAELSWSLWCSKLEIGSLDRANLISQDGAPKLCYDNEWDMMELHRTQNENPEAFNGKEVLLICSPGICVAGDIEGRDYSDVRAWKAAVVLVG